MVLDGSLVLAHVRVGVAPVGVGLCKLGVEAYSLVVVLDGPLGLAQECVGDAPVVVGIGILRVEADGLVEFGNGLLIMPLL